MLRFAIIFIFLLSLQYLGAGIPKANDIYFYVGYFSAPLLLVFLINFLLDLLTSKKWRNLFNKEEKMNEYKRAVKAAFAYGLLISLLFNLVMIIHLNLWKNF